MYDQDARFVRRAVRLLATQVRHPVHRNLPVPWHVLHDRSQSLRQALRHHESTRRLPTSADRQGKLHELFCFCCRMSDVIGNFCSCSPIEAHSPSEIWNMSISYIYDCRCQLSHHLPVMKKPRPVWLFLCMQTWTLQRDYVTKPLNLFGLVGVNIDDFFEFNHAANTSGHAYKLFKSRSVNNTFKHFFAKRIINVWNGLPPSVSIQASNTESWF